LPTPLYPETEARTGRFPELDQNDQGGDGNDFYRVNGAGEMLVFFRRGFEDFLVPRPDLLPVMESELKAVIRHLVENRWPFRLHATYNETIERALNVYEDVNREIPFDGLHWFFDHCETISDRNIERVKALGGGIAVQNRMAFKGVFRPAIRDTTSPTDTADPADAGNRRSGWGGYRRNARLKLQPYLSLYWLITGKTIGVAASIRKKSARSGGSTQTLHDG